MSPRPRVLLVEDDDALRDAVAAALEDAGYAVDARADGLELRRVLAGPRPDLALLDVRLARGPNGLSLLTMIREIGSLPVLVLTAAAGLDQRLAGFAAGADDYLVKPFEMAELLARIAALLRRSGRVHPTSWQVADLVVDPQARIVHRADQPIELTRLQFDLLAVLGRLPGQVVPKSRLLATVWGFDAFEPNLVEVHVSALRRKLEAHGPRLVHTVRGVGYRLAPPTD